MSEEDRHRTKMSHDKFTNEKKLVKSSTLAIGIRVTLKNRARCSKLMTSLVNVSLKFQTLISQINQYFC